MSKILNNTENLQSLLEILQDKAVNPDTSDATATASDILSGKTAYVSGQKITGNIAFAPAKTITPSTTSQIAISSGYYASGNITVAGDTNLVAENIKKGTNIFGVTGNYEGSGGSGEVDYSIEDSLVTRDVTTYTNNRVTKIGNFAFYNCSKLTSINFPACLNIGGSAFTGCTHLSLISFPVCSQIEEFAFYNCISLISASFSRCLSVARYAFTACHVLNSLSFPMCSYIKEYAFNNCKLTTISFPVCSYIGSGAFQSCTSLTSADFGNNLNISKCSIYPSAFATCSTLTNLTLRYSFVATLSNINAFASTPISVSTLTGLFGSIYVPYSLLSVYKTATNWATYADRISSILGNEEDVIGATLTYITVLYTGGRVLVDTPLSSLANITVLAYYSNDVVLEVKEYTLSGVIAEGDNIITVTYQDKTATFIVIGASNLLINFTVNDIVYQASEGMTLGDWVNSEFNTDEYYFDVNGTFKNNEGKVVYTASYGLPKKSEVIIEGVHYQTL